MPTCRDLRRTAIGSFTTDGAVAIEDLTVEHLLTPAQAMRDLTPITVDEDIAAAVGHGKQLPLDRLGASGLGPWAVLDGAGRLLAVYEPHRTGTAKPSVVLAPAGQS